MPSLDYPLQDKLTDSQGMCKVYEEYKVKRRVELQEKPIEDLMKKNLFDKEGPKELVPLDQELIQDKLTF